jgi:hypothetical protein
VPVTLELPAPGTFTQDPGLFAPHETSVLGARPPSPPTIPIPRIAPPEPFTQQPELFAPVEVSLLGRPRFRARSGSGSGSPRRTSFGSLAAGSVPVLGSYGSAPQGQGQAQSYYGSDMFVGGGSWESPVLNRAAEQEQDAQAALSCLGSAIPGLDSSVVLPSDGSFGFGGLSANGLIRFGGPNASQHSAGEDLYCSQLDRGVEDDVGETSMMLERDIEYERWLAREEDPVARTAWDGLGSSQEVLEAVRVCA